MLWIKYEVLAVRMLAEGVDDALDVILLVEASVVVTHNDLPP